MSSFDHMDKNGRLVDTLTYRAQPSEGLKPPIHGLALLWLMKNRDLSGITLEDKLWTWEGLERWTNYWLKFRDCDRDGIVEYQNIIETGWEDSPTYMAGFPNATPELNAMIALNMEALAKFGREIGKDKAVCDEWQAKSEELVARIPEVFWNGEKWFAFNPDTGKKSDSDSIALYSTLMLGKRLPREIIDKSIETLFGPVGFNTEFGLASEATTSPYFRHGFAAGSIITPAQFLMAHALEECGRPDLAREVANKYCAILRDHGFFHIHNALTGREDRSMTAFGERGLFWSAWASSCYFYLAEKYGD
jgi:glycogen debranching enzyme